MKHRAGTLDRALVRALIRALAVAAHQAGAAAGDARATPGRATRGLVALAVRVLPVSQRSRYREELHVELAELPSLARPGYALRVLVSAWALRQALTETER